ncbi:hypothetical protein [Burkholderia vietnamiensis]|uniref:hypothetical protein n=1 Tax=Burkholderia vietnamiensis TaxID=60552 RepID=UPI001D13D4F2|nr:hypothetical protein [Burkholderia vietnamiensis]UEC02575.1 hypothetical protein LK462_11385 [Burkholderia vietnamiensis]
MREFQSIEVFQDLSITVDDRATLRDALLDVLVAPWQRDVELEDRLRRTSVRADEMLAFRRDGDTDVDAATLTLWPDGISSYKVTNIVPREKHQLSEHEYNAVLRDFVQKVVEPAHARSSMEVSLTSPTQGPLDWTSTAAATALLLFSAAANKSTGASHPQDHQRWMAFLVEEHRTGTGKLTPSLLAQWLYKAEAWPEEVAHRLATDFESALELLGYYDEHR